MLFTYQKQQYINIDLQLSNSKIQRTKCAKFLGLYIEDKLKWDEHIYMMKKEISTSFFAINKVKHIMPKRQLSTFYYRISIVNLWHYIMGSNTSCSFIKIDHNAKKSIRVITGAHYRAHTAPIFKRLHFLKLVDFYQLQVNKYVLSFLNGLLASLLKHIFTL